MKRVISALVMCIMMVAAVGCGGGGSKSEVVGSWKIKSVEIAGMSVDISQMDEASGMGAEMDAVKNMELKFNDGGKGEAVAEGIIGSGDDASFTWKEDGDKITMTSAGQDLPLTYDKDAKTLTLEEPTSGMKMVFEKK